MNQKAHHKFMDELIKKFYKKEKIECIFSI